MTSEWEDCRKVCESSKLIMESLGADSMATTMNKAVSAFQVMVSVSQLAGVASTLMSAKNSYLTTVSASLTAAKSALGPVGWANIALAVGAGASAAVLTTAICHYKLKANLSQPSGIEAVKQFIGNVI